MTDQELYDWVLSLKPDDLPTGKWKLYPWASVTDNQLFLEALQQQAQEGDKAVRSKNGVLQDDIKQLKSVVDRWKNEYTNN